MSFHRIIIAALAAWFVTGTASVASADCGGCGWGSPAFFAYQPAPLYVFGGCGGCGQLAVTYAPVPYAPPAFAPAQPPLAPAPIAADHWDTGGWGGWGGCGCGRCGCGRSVVYAAPALAPIYVVNQGPEYTGPGVVVPYGTYAPQADLAAPGDYPYVSHRGYGYGVRRPYGHPYYHGAGPHFAYGERGYVHPHHYGPAPYWHRHPYLHRPLGVRG